MRVRLLGPVEICLNGRTVEATDWTYHKARELFFFLLAQPPADKAQIGLALWPDATTEQLRNEFHRTLYYLRRAIGHPDWVQYSQGRYCLSSTARLWCDLHEFERSMRAAQPLRRPGGVAASDRAELVAALESATGLWRGDFLADTPAGEWAIERGEPLRQVCLQALLDLGQLYLLEADYGQAERTFHRLLALDNLVEVAHRELMRCYSRQGERGRAIRHYQALSRLLQDELHTSPSPETRQLYERLHRGDDL
jgi:DNA-binding SARP family transcriptional activator